MAAEKSKSSVWLPLESNPDVMNVYLQKLGCPTASTSFVDVLSTDDWALEMVPSPVKSVVLLFPIKKHTEEARHEHAAVAAEQSVPGSLFFTKQVRAGPCCAAWLTSWYMPGGSCPAPCPQHSHLRVCLPLPQTIPNACGTIGLLHAVGNNCTVFGGDIKLTPGSFFAKYFGETGVDATPEARASALEADNTLEESHAEAASAGQTTASADVDTHFVAFVCKGGKLWELDGRRAGPVDWGTCTEDELLEKAAGIIKAEYIEKDPEEMRFAMTALVGVGADSGETEGDAAAA